MALSRWNGSAFVTPAAVKRWNGSAFQDVSFVRRWDGSAWVIAWPAVKLTNTSKDIVSEFGTFSPVTSNCTAGLGFRSTGEMEAFASEFGPSWFVITPTDEWMLPVGGDSSLFEIRATTSPAGVSSTNGSGSPVSVTAWTALSAGRRFTVSSSRSTVGSTTVASGSFTIEIRDASRGVVVASCTASLSATATVEP